MSLPADFIERPFAHRALHDAGAGRPENSCEAIAAAIASDYGIEIDLQLSSDGVPMVFHDYHLGRVTDATGPVTARSAAALRGIKLRGGSTGIPTFDEVLELVDRKVPLLVELKDQDGAMGGNVGPLECAVATCLAAYAGPIAVMSFNPNSVAAIAAAMPDVPRGIATCSYSADTAPALPGKIRDHLRAIPDYDRTGASFISHEVDDLSRPRVAQLKADGATILCWTVRSPNEEAVARQIADQVTFEGYLA